MGGWIVDRRVRLGHDDAYFQVHVFSTLIGIPLCVAAFLVGNGVLALLLLGFGVMVFGSFGAASYSTLQVLAPPRMRQAIRCVYFCPRRGRHRTWAVERRVRYRQNPAGGGKARLVDIDRDHCGRGLGVVVLWTGRKPLAAHAQRKAYLPPR